RRSPAPQSQAGDDGAEPALPRPAHTRPQEEGLRQHLATDRRSPAVQEPGIQSWEGHLSRQPLNRTAAHWPSPGERLAGPAFGDASHAAAFAGTVQQPVTTRTA